MKCSNCNKEILKPIDQYGDPENGMPLCFSCDFKLQQEWKVQNFLRDLFLCGSTTSIIHQGQQLSYLEE